MSVPLLAAVEAADDRKRAVLGDDTVQVSYSGGESQDRAVFSGFGLDHDEMIQIARLAGKLFWLSTQQIPALSAFTGAWTDGLLVGLLYARLQETARLRGSEDDDA